jgi:hypothetical protein
MIDKVFCDECKRFYVAQCPDCVHEAALGRLADERNKVEQEYSDLIFLCKQMLAAWDASEERNAKLCEPDTMSLEAHDAIEAIRGHVTPGPEEEA